MPGLKGTTTQLSLADDGRGRRLGDTSHGELWVPQRLRLARKKGNLGLEIRLGDVTEARLDARETQASLVAQPGMTTAGEAARERGAQTCA
jgi:hypothetical protein